jgi:hypothetical protein
MDASSLPARYLNRRLLAIVIRTQHLAIGSNGFTAL